MPSLEPDRRRRGPEPFSRWFSFSPVRGMRSLMAVSVAAAVCLTTPGVALADGYETPNLYSARHVGQGTTGIAYVDDPTALARNPAGLSGTDFVSLIIDFSFLLTQVTGSPATDNQNLESDIKPVPLGLAGAAYRVTDWLTFGLATYPVAAAGADYIYDNAAGNEIANSLELIFWEISPGVSFDIPGGVKFGAGWRVTVVSLTQFEGPRGADDGANDFQAVGVDLLGFRVGLQWEVYDGIEVGAVYRHTIYPKIDGEGRLLNQEGKIETEFTLPAILGFGARGELGPVALSADFEWGFHSQAEDDLLEFTTDSGVEIPLENIQNWDDGATVHVGVEYLVTGLEALALRAGYIWDQNSTDPAYPSPWGTPPGDTHMPSFGAGWDGGPWEVNVAWSWRFGDGEATQEAFDLRDRPCEPCGRVGEYAVDLHGIYVDFSWEFED